MKSVPLEQIARIHGGGRLQLSGKDFVEHGVPAYGAGGLNGFLPVAESNEPAVILGSVGTCGHCYLPDGPWTSLANTQVIIPDASQADVRFLWYQLNDPSSWHVSGTSQKFIKPSDVKTRAVWLPELREQQRIVELLESVDAWMVEARRQATLLAELELSCFSQASSHAAAAIRLSDVGQIHGGGRLRLSGKDFVDSGVPAYGAGGRNGLLEMAEYTDRDAVILSSIGARCGKAFLARGAWTSLANTQVILPDPAKADPVYLWFLLNDEGRWPRSGSAQPFIKPSDVKAHLVALPPLGEQRRFAARYRAIESQRGELERALVLHEELRASVQHRFFGGK